MASPFFLKKCSFFGIPLLTNAKNGHILKKMKNAMKETLVWEATGRRRHRLKALLVVTDKGNAPEQAV